MYINTFLKVNMLINIHSKVFRYTSSTAYMYVHLYIILYINIYAVTLSLNIIYIKN